MQNTDPLHIPAWLRRAPSEQPLRETSLEVRQRREAHRIAKSCAELLERDRKRRARAARKRRKPRRAK